MDIMPNRGLALAATAEQRSGDGIGGSAAGVTRGDAGVERGPVVVLHAVGLPVLQEPGGLPVRPVDVGGRVGVHAAVVAVGVADPVRTVEEADVEVVQGHDLAHDGAGVVVETVVIVAVVGVDLVERLPQDQCRLRVHPEPSGFR
jgi:hypothetical protein